MEGLVSSDNVTLTLARHPGVATRIAKGIAGMFYIHNPAETTFQHPEQVPTYFRNAWPYFLIFMIVEQVVLWLQKKPTARLNDSITSLSHGVLHECGRLIFRGSEAAAYIYLYDNWRLLDLNWASPITWYLTVVGVDFCYYWVHRANHEVSILWAQHQVHHSSEDFNLAVGLRQSILQGWCSFIFYFPLAFVIPPSHFLVHQQLNLLYQFWIHTRAVESMGPLEWVLNTPKHHRVHHGCNAFCIDVNYGGLLIVWDRLFGTFAQDRPKEDIVYGLVYNEPSFNPLFLQVFYNQHVINKWKSMESWQDKICVIIKGPSWVPGSPWAGDPNNRIDIQSRAKYDVVLPVWCNIYITIHFLIVLFFFHQLLQQYSDLSEMCVVNACGVIATSLLTLGLLLDQHRWAPVAEAARCVVCCLLNRSYLKDDSFLLTTLLGFFAVSAALWLLRASYVKGESKVKQF